MYFYVFATRIGLVGKITASGIKITEDLVFAALPSRSALFRIVEVRWQRNVIICPVLDVGPWSADDEYWKKSGIPAAQLGYRNPKLMEKYGPPKNPAGIDLSNAAMRRLQIRGNAWVCWRFLSTVKAMQ